MNHSDRKSKFLFKAELRLAGELNLHPLNSDIKKFFNCSLSFQIIKTLCPFFDKLHVLVYKVCKLLCACPTN